MEAVGVDGAGGADGKGAVEEAAVDGEALGGGLDAVEAVADPFGALDGAGFAVELEAGGDFAAPVVGIAEEEDGVGGDGCRFCGALLRGCIRNPCRCRQGERWGSRGRIRLAARRAGRGGRSFWRRCKDFAFVR